MQPELDVSPALESNARERQQCSGTAAPLLRLPICIGICLAARHMRHRSATQRCPVRAAMAAVPSAAVSLRPRAASVSGHERAATRYAEGLWSRRYSDSSTSARAVDCCRRVFLYKVLTALPDRATQPLRGGAAWKRVGLAPKRPQVQILSPQPDSPTCNESLTTVARPVIDENSHDDSNVHQQNSKAHVAWRLVRRGRPVS